MFKNLIAVSCISAFLLLGGCETYQSGDLPTQARLDAVKEGVHSKEQVLRMLGTPVFVEEQENFIMYGKIRKKSQAFMEPKEFERDIYVFYFNNSDVLTKKQHLTLADAHSVSYDSKTTKTQHKELSVTDQLIKNFGRYDAGGRDSSERR